MRTLLPAVIAFCLLSVPASFCQENQVSRQNRSVEVVVTETVKAAPDVAVVRLGCVTYGATNHEAYQSNLKIADQVIQAILKAGVSKEQIQGSTIQLGENFQATNRSDQKERQFEAHQTWQIRLAASAAQKIIDDAVAAGANGIENVSWDVSDPAALEGKARAAAMKKAREIAGQIAEAGGAKLGELIYASNASSEVTGVPPASGIAGQAFASLRGVAVPAFSLKLFPSKVEKEATVRAIFALD